MTTVDQQELLVPLPSISVSCSSVRVLISSEQMLQTASCVITELEYKMFVVRKEKWLKHKSKYSFSLSKIWT